MRILRFPGWWLLALLGCAGWATADEPRPHRVGELSFVLPDTWQTHEVPGSAATGVVFSARGPANSSFTVARLPITAAPAPLSAAQMDPMSAPENAMYRLFLEESGLTPVSGAATSLQEGGTVVTSIDFACKGEGAAQTLVLTCTWSTAREVLRARLQYLTSAPPEQMAELEAIRASLRFAGFTTIGFGPFQMTSASPLPNAAAWAKAAPPGKPVGSPATPTPVAASRPA